MYLKTLHLRQFRNYEAQDVAFDAPKTILVGNNAQGKSNLLEAVELLSTLKSHRVNHDRDLVLDNHAIAQITATLERDSGTLDLALTLRSQGRRTVAINSQSVKRHLDFLSILNVVQFSSLDLDLVRGGPAERRHWLDRLLIQLEPVYAYMLDQYNQVLRQRNALLKRGPMGGTTPEELAIWDAQLAVAGTRVLRRRDRVIERLEPLARMWHQSISGSTETLNITYQPNIEPPCKPQQRWSQLPPEQVQQAFLTKISTRAIAERSQGLTLVGPHRDDVIFTINQTPARQYGSSGQQRTLVLALKLAELQLIESVIGEPPLLLLDDVLAELDPHRQNQLLQAISERFQTLITTTHLGAFDHQWLQQSQILMVAQGKITDFF
ncbi:MAG: DNA replication/repair protein RecF [Arthrospira sp. SH-MAG29]|nr:DNA replication/repair protein RecF [Arthrospira sp. SH-MAG29]MBS0016527.1 DNA replication/repair protein RecF [Arthrospira sp. SH-MAG29]